MQGYIRVLRIMLFVINLSPPHVHSRNPSTTFTGASSWLGKALTKVVLHRGDIVVATSANPPFSPLLLLPHKSSLLPSMLLFLSTSPPSSPGPKKSLGDLTSCSTRDVWRGQRRAL
ncbi:hypothetical protein L210DRAFT_3591125 [Boletus edulis BED1]|uniref:Uncharacterized protein n=1 Tax=Boletus edulis BED1 TaxID=1328754 RepID=A0AAD4G5R2_BOLED|nr:hypothetical protein L210DRAFT_3591125 [Boletus edulis BED1]